MEDTFRLEIESDLSGTYKLIKHIGMGLIKVRADDPGLDFGLRLYQLSEDIGSGRRPGSTKIDVVVDWTSELCLWR